MARLTAFTATSRMDLRQKTAKTRILLPVLSELFPRGDGSYILRPAVVPDPEGDTWLTLPQAAKLLDVSARIIKRKLLGTFLVYCRPSPKVVKVLLQSAQRLRQATLDPDFWSDPTLQAPLKKWVEQESRKRVEASLHL